MPHIQSSSQGMQDLRPPGNPARALTKACRARWALCNTARAQTKAWNPERMDWTLGGGVGGWESWEEGLEAGNPGRRLAGRRDWRLRVLGIGAWEEGLEAGRRDWRPGVWGSGEEKLEARNPGRRDWKLGGRRDWSGSGLEAGSPGMRGWRLGIRGGGIGGWEEEGLEARDWRLGILGGEDGSWESWRPGRSDWRPTQREHKPRHAAPQASMQHSKSTDQGMQGQIHAT